jgi:uncharacterized protein YbaP (TraB family)
MYKKHLFISLVFLGVFSNLPAQKKPAEKYQSLLWEISGNGLGKPSYLFGTMHVSSKMAFHLSDSFYQALRSVDAVALELNPELWQGQMARLDQLKDNYASFVQPAGNDFLTENSFRLENYVTELTAALSTEPAVVNNLLYRSYKTREDFEEDTFLDLYIYQTGRKLGKRPAGVEDYYEAEKLVLEAYGDMAREKKKKNIDLDGESIRDISEKVQNAYRRGDLDLMDSLDNLMERSDAFREKFLFKRNEIQANSIDSIIRKTSLFAGVGAAHLPGSRGVIELLRNKGYTLRPVKMTDRDGVQRNSIDNLNVPVSFQKRVSEDGFYSVDVPGELFKINQDYQSPDRRQFADMSNGSYYMVTRVPTHAAFLNQPEEKVQKKVDSVLYENIPGKLLSKKEIEKNSYKGYDIVARTRRGDLQRYNIFITPFEILIFKMSGKEDYVSGKEASQFFSSIQLKEQTYSPVNFSPAHGGFTIRLPHAPHQYLNNTTADGRWEYEAVDKATGEAYLVLKQSVYNYNFIDEDTFTLSLLEASFHNDELFDKQLSRKQVSFNGKTALEVKERLKDGSLVNALFYINGPHYYTIAVRGNTVNAVEYFHSFRPAPYQYQSPVAYIDTFLHAKVQTAIVPEIDEGLRRIIEQAADDAANGYNYSGYISYWPKTRSGIFKSDSTGEMVAVQVQAFPKYFYIKDSAKYWASEIEDLRSKSEMILGSVRYINDKDVFGIGISLKDTGSSKIINRLMLVKNNYKYMLAGISDSLYDQKEFAQSFFATFRPLPDTDYRNIYENKLPQFMNDLFSKDSAVQSRAQQSISNIYFGRGGVPAIQRALGRLSIADKDYYEVKNKLIAELGYIKDSTGGVIVPLLKKIYDQSADTSLFQNEVIKALSRLQTKEAYTALRQLLLKDPPIFDNGYDLNSVFSNLADTLRLSAGLFPDVLQLFTLDDYKDKLLSLLVKGVDSNFIGKAGYEKYFPNIFIDAKVALKKQKNRDEKRRQSATKNKDTEAIRVFSSPGSDNNPLSSYAILLMPFYDTNKEVQLFFNGLLRSGDEKLKLNTAVLMLKNNKPVADSIMQSLAANEKYRGMLYDKLVKNKIANKYPLRYRSQLDLARSYILMENDYDRMDSLVYLSKQAASYKGLPGYVYFFKYRIQKDNDWKIGIVGLQPLDEKELSSEPVISQLTDVKIKADEPLADQLNAQLKRILFTLHKSGKNFFAANDEFRRFD